MAQVRKYNPPPNPAKVTDSRFEGYQREHGDESWELDALEPRVMGNLVRAAIAKYRDKKQWAADVARENSERALLRDCAERWPEVAAHLQGE
jgi:hypothetical protein